MEIPALDDTSIDRIDAWAYEVACLWFQHPLMQHSYLYDGIDLGDATTYGFVQVILDGIKQELAR